MSKIEELILKLCPNGVEYKKLKDVCSFQNGFAFKSELFKSSGEKILRITNIADGRLSEDNYAFFHKEDYRENLSLYEVHKGDIVVAMSGATTGKIGCNYQDEVFYLNQRVGLFRPNENVLSKRYLYHWLLSKSSDILNISSGTGAQPNLSSNKMMEFQLAVPPLEVQCEIVHILDDFTLLSAELSAELNARIKQYEFYKEKLLTFSEKDTNIEWVSLGTYCKRLKGTAITAGKMKEIAEENGNVKIFAGGKTMIYTDESNIPSEDVIRVPNIIVQSRGIIDFIFYDKPCSYKREMWSYTLENTTTLKYIYYYLKNNVEYFRQRGSQMGSMPQISLDVTEKYKIPIPEYNEQKRIVNILDRFDKLCNDITEGLPAEIEARQKQYEYYRDKLLTFKELVNEG